MPTPQPPPYTTLFRSAYERNARYSVSEKPNTYDEITTYNNFYEFGTDKESPSEYARMMRTRPWSVTVAHHARIRSEEHTSEIQSLRHLVCRLLLETKK